MVPATDRVLAAGVSGFLHQRQGVAGVVWTGYATGADRTLPALAGLPGASFVSAGGDALFWLDVNAGVLRVAAPDHDSPTTYPIPAGWTVADLAENGTRALAFKPVSSAGPGQLEVLDLGADGGVTPVPVTGLPDGALISATPTNGTTDGDRHGIVQYQARTGAATQYALVDLDTGAAVPVPGMSGATRVLLTPSDVAWVLRDTTHVATVVKMLPQSAVLDGSAASMTPASVTIPDLASYTFLPVGDHLLTVETQSLAAPAPKPLVDHPFGGGDATTVMGADLGAPAAASDGSVLSVGGADATVSGVHRYQAAAGGALADTTVLDLPPLPSTNAGLSLANGFLRHIENIPAAGAQQAHLALHNYPIAAGTDTGSGRFGGSYPATLPATALPCEAGKSCVRTVDGNWYGTSFLMADGPGPDSRIHSEIDGATSTMTVPLPFEGGRIVDASLDYQVVESATTQYVVQTGQREVSARGPVTGAALWDNTFWQASTTGAAGTVNAFDLTSYPTKAVRSIATGVACRPTELQVSQHWLYWSCGTTGHAGVYDLASGRKIAVPPGRALLGDGYLVQHDAAAGRLVMTDFHSGTAAAPVRLADLPDSGLTDDRGITFAVDRHGSDVAYVAADRTVHVLAPGVPASPLTATAPTGQQQVYPRSSSTGVFNAYITLDRPVDGWQLTISDAATGKTAATFNGGPAHEIVSVQWGGHLASGALALSGPYKWKLTATAGGAATAVQGASGTLVVFCGALRFRSYDCDGQQAMLGVRHGPYGGYEGHWWGATATGGLVDGGYTDDWIPGTGPGDTSALVPFGDINGDGTGDLLARDPSGVLTAYLGLGQAYFNTGEADVKRVRIGGGWNIYNTLLSTGDLNGDGHDDLVARDAAGVLWFYAGTGKSSLTSRVRIGGGWNTYTKLVATGDLTGDGAGDLVAVDGSGVMWRYSGNKQGGFTTRVKIGAGWTMYNTIVGFGDLSHDGNNDLVARDSAGRLWRYDGTASGVFSGARVQIGSGFNSYVGLY
ncbi:VCBS repeat-containing protein [Streptomyces sp. NBC_00433]